MSGAPPPPPPLPSSIKPLNSRETPSKKDLPYENDNLWASDFPEIQKACYFSNSRISSKPRSCAYYEIPSILQEGPTCGLTAISMMLLGNPPPNKILESAVKSRFSFFGEMFSAENLHQVIVEVAPKEAKSYIMDCNLDCDDFRKELTDGRSCALVTYPNLLVLILNFVCELYGFSVRCRKCDELLLAVVKKESVIG